MALPDPTTLVAFVPAAVALILAPGPDTVYVLGRGMRDGTRPGVAGAAGVATGVLVHATAAALGLAALFRAVPAAYTAVRVAGGVYLLFLAVRTLRSGEAFTVSAGDESPARGPARSYAGGLLVNVLNPKVALFFLAFLPQFLGPDAGVVEPLGLGAVYALLTVGYLGGVAWFAESVGAGLGARPRVGRALHLLTAAVLGAFGGWALVDAHSRP
ncbi:LysE family translocator [Salinirubellus salinus]|uniref:LysE family translocator n=1 Tax=Salinirubellus salinus TaxID=1364945 RepID=A0A9E7UD76_9EURY|nr:LysE family translocator [Salinirubellus salinus]UWM56734.1 LysE family translocator [Salinirubellus salinus]